MTSRSIEYKELRSIFAMHGETRQLLLIESLSHSDKLAAATLVAMWRTEPKPSILRWVARALCSFRSSEANACVIEALAHPNMSVRLHAVSGIQRNAREEMLAFIRPLVSDGSGAVRLRAPSTLVAVQAEGVEPLLKVALADTKDYVRSLACRALSVNSGRR